MLFSIEDMENTNEFFDNYLQERKQWTFPEKMKNRKKRSKARERQTKTRLV